VLELAPNFEAVLLTLVTLARQFNHRLTRMEQKMTDLDDLINAEQTTLADIIRVLATTAADVGVLLSRATGVFTPEERAKADATLATLNALGAAVSNLSVQVGDQNADGEPPTPPPPPEPTPEPPPEPTV